MHFLLVLIREEFLEMYKLHTKICSEKHVHFCVKIRPRVLIYV